MKNIFTLVIALFTTSFFFSQELRDAKITEELTNWDPVRGAWLAESMEAIATDKPIPDRHFPEEFTPAEMYSTVPADRQRVIQDRINNNRQNAPEDQRTSWNRMNGFVSRSNCQLTMARSYGDPHITSFDGKSYSFQTVGEFVMARSSDGKVEVQARQKPESDRVSLNTAVAMNVHGDRVAIYASDFPDGNSATPVRVAGQPVYVQNGIYYLPRGGTIENNGKAYTVTWPTGEKVQAKISRSGRMDFMNLSVHVFPCSSMYNGILGNANGNPNDDFGSRGSSMASSTIFDPMDDRTFNDANTNMEREYLSFLANDFARGFRVTQATSLFDYGFGQSTWTFTDESFPRVHLTLADLSQNDRNNARRICEQQGISREDMAACIFDVGHANIQPTPRPVIANRTDNRPLRPVDGRTPNVNPSQDGRVPVVAPNPDAPDRTPNPVSPVTKPDSKVDTKVNPKVEDQPVGTRDNSTVKPQNTNSTVTKKPETKQPEPVKEPVKKPVFEPAPVKEPVSKPMEPAPKKPEPVIERKPVSSPSPNPVSKPTPVSTPKPVDRSSVTAPKTTSTPIATPKTPSSGGTGTTVRPR